MTNEQIQKYMQLRQHAANMALASGLGPEQTNQLLNSQYQSQLAQQGVNNYGNRPANQTLYGCTPNPADYGSLLGAGLIPGPQGPIYPNATVTTNNAGAITSVNVTNPGTAYAGIPVGHLIWYGDDGLHTEPPKPIENAGIKVGEITGWRIWNLRKGYLQSYSAERIYAPGEPMVADPEHMSDYSHDGIWAFKERSRALEKMLDNKATAGGSVCGSIKMWGKVIEHELGYRAEFASIVSLDDWITHDRNETRKNKKQILQDLRETYGLAA